jgi:hypothetical protein
MVSDGNQFNSSSASVFRSQIKVDQAPAENPDELQLAPATTPSATAVPSSQIKTDQAPRENSTELQPCPTKSRTTLAFSPFSGAIRPRICPGYAPDMPGFNLTQFRAGLLKQPRAASAAQAARKLNYPVT